MLSTFFRRPRVFVPVVIALLALIAGAVYLSRRPTTATPVLAYSEFLQRIDRGQVKEIRAAADGSLVLTLADGSTANTVYGIYVTDSAGNLTYAERFPAPLLVSSIGDTIAYSARTTVIDQ